MKTSLMKDLQCFVKEIEYKPREIHLVDGGDRARLALKEALVDTGYENIVE